MKTAVENLVEKLKEQSIDLTLWHNDLIQEAIELEIKQQHKYAEFAIICDRKRMKILNFNDWLKL